MKKLFCLHPNLHFSSFLRVLDSLLRPYSPYWIFRYFCGRREVMICPLTGSGLYNQLMRWKKNITVTSSKSDTAKAAVIHLLNDGSCVFLVCMAAATSALWCCLINAAGLWCLKIHSTAWFIRLSIFWGGELTKCILGPWQSSPKLFRIYNTMLGRERENADEISSCCSAKAICMTSVSWKSHSRARK